MLDENQKKLDLIHLICLLSFYSLKLLIQALNTQLTDAGYEKITKEDLLFRNRQGKFELVVDPKQIVIVGLDQIKKESDSSSINSILSILDM